MLVGMFVAVGSGLAVGWLLNRFGENVIAIRLQLIIGVILTLAAAVVVVSLLSEKNWAWTNFVLPFGFGWALADMPKNFAEMRRHGKLEDLARAWWRKDLGEDEIRQALAEHRIDQRVYDIKRTDLYRMFNRSFMQGFEDRFGFAREALRASAAQPIG